MKLAAVLGGATAGVGETRATDTGIRAPLMRLNFY
jgi:hypothetical protein